MFLLKTFFEAPLLGHMEGYGMKSQQFFDNITRILLHAFVGTTISTFVVAFILHWLLPLTSTLQLSMAECLAFGAMISSTDPVTTLAIFKEQRLAENGRGHLYYSVLGESILNDAVAITLFSSFVNLVKSQEVITAAVAGRIILEFASGFLASTLIGVAGGLLTAFLLKSARLGAGACEGEHFFFNVPEIGVTSLKVTKKTLKNKQTTPHFRNTFGCWHTFSWFLFFCGGSGTSKGYIYIYI